MRSATWPTAASSELSRRRLIGGGPGGRVAAPCAKTEHHCRFCIRLTDDLQAVASTFRTDSHDEYLVFFAWAAAKGFTGRAQDCTGCARLGAKSSGVGTGSRSFDSPIARRMGDGHRRRVDTRAPLLAR